MSSRLVLRFMLGFYFVLFFGFLFGPLVIMCAAAFNTPSYPQAWPIEGLTLEWFAKLIADRNVAEGLHNSFLIGAFVVACRRRSASLARS